MWHDEREGLAYACELCGGSHPQSLGIRGLTSMKDVVGEACAVDALIVSSSLYWSADAGVSSCGIDGPSCHEDKMLGVAFAQFGNVDDIAFMQVEGFHHMSGKVYAPVTVESHVSVAASLYDFLHFHIIYSV